MKRPLHTQSYFCDACNSLYKYLSSVHVMTSGKTSAGNNFTISQQNSTIYVLNGHIQFILIYFAIKPVKYTKMAKL